MIPNIPIIVTMLGVIIHLFGLTKVLPMASIEMDLVMFITDSLVVYGLMKRKNWGWYLAVVLFIHQSIMQIFWGYQKYASHFFVIHPLEDLIAPALCIISLVILIKYRNIYLDSTIKLN